MRTISVNYIIDDETDSRLDRLLKTYCDKAGTADKLSKDTLFGMLMTMGENRKIDETLDFAETMLGVSC